LGVEELTRIRSDLVIVDDRVLEMCETGCPGYGKSLMCPPHSPTPDAMRKVLGDYSDALVLRLVRTFPPDQKWPPIREDLAAVESALKGEGFIKARALAAGPCELCDPCNLDQCAHPEAARPAMEACGIDVLQTAKNAGFKGELAMDPTGPMDIYCLILLA